MAFKVNYETLRIDDCIFNNNVPGDYLLVNMKCSNCGVTCTHKLFISEDDKGSDGNLMKELQNFVLFHKCYDRKEYGIARVISIRINEEKKVENESNKSTG